MIQFPLGFPNKTLYAPFLSPLLATCPTNLILLDMISRIMFVTGCKWGSFWSCGFLNSPLAPLMRKCQALYPRIQRPWPLVPAALFPSSFKVPSAGARTSNWWMTARLLYCLVPYSVHSLLYHRPLEPFKSNLLWGTSYVQLFAFVSCISKPRYLQESENFTKWLTLISGKKRLWTAKLTFRRRIKSRLPFAGIIRRLTYSTGFQDKGKIEINFCVSMHHYIWVYWDQLDANCLVLFYYTFLLYMFRM